MTHHGLRMPGEEIAFTARSKINSQSQIFRYSWRTFCLPLWLKFLDFFDSSLGVCSPCNTPKRKLFNRSARLFSTWFFASSLISNKTNCPTYLATYLDYFFHRLPYLLLKHKKKNGPVSKTFDFQSLFCNLLSCSYSKVKVKNESVCILNSLNEDDCNLKITNSMSVFQVKIDQGIESQD